MTVLPLTLQSCSVPLAVPTTQVGSRAYSVLPVSGSCTERGLNCTVVKLATYVMFVPGSGFNRNVASTHPSTVTQPTSSVRTRGLGWAGGGGLSRSLLLTMSTSSLTFSVGMSRHNMRFSSAVQSSGGCQLFPTFL